jgi:hypothetical protein
MAKKQKVSIEDLKFVAKEMNSFLDDEKSSEINIKAKRPELEEDIKTIFAILEPEEDSLTPEAEGILYSMGLDTSKFKIHRSEKWKKPKSEPVKEHTIDTKYKLVSDELNKILKLEDPIGLDQSTKDLEKEIMEVVEECINDDEFEESEFSNLAKDLFKKLKLKIKWKEPKKKEDIEIHPLALIIPEMDREQFDNLRADIKENGLKVPIITKNGRIIDGRSRYLACKQLGLTPDFLEWAGKEKDILEQVISLNVKRRHLSSSQRAALAAELLPQFEKVGKQKQVEGGKGKKSEDKFRATEEVAKVVGSSKGSVTIAKRVRKEDPDTFEKMKTGTTTISEIGESKDQPSLLKVFRKMKKCVKEAENSILEFKGHVGTYGHKKIHQKWMLQGRVKKEYCLLPKHLAKQKIKEEFNS